MDIKTLSEEIRNCKKCSLCETRTKVVIGRGSMTPDIVFIGEAPGAEIGKRRVGKECRL